jgi:preprotein translocase subunit SecA
VFFENVDTLHAFYKSLAFEEVKKKHKVMYITPSTDKSERDEIVDKHSTYSGSITLLSGAYARGTDFRCFDEELIENGGIHVIGAYLPVFASEITQMKGRGPRQGNPGSFQLILDSQDLEKSFGVPSNSSSPELVEEKRQFKANITVSNIRTKITKLKSLHDASEVLKWNLLKYDGNMDSNAEILKSLIELN